MQLLALRNIIMGIFIGAMAAAMIIGVYANSNQIISKADEQTTTANTPSYEDEYCESLRAQALDLINQFQAGGLNQDQFNQAMDNIVAEMRGRDC